MAALQGKALEEVPAVHPLPWFGTVEGYALVPPEGALMADEDPAAIVVLTEGGQLMVHDLRTFTPVPLNLPFQVGASVVRDLRKVAHL